MSGVEALARVLWGSGNPGTDLGGGGGYVAQAERILADPGPLLAALAEAGVGEVRHEWINTPVTVERVPDYSCRPCRDGDHANCRGREVYVDWSHNCECAYAVPHRVAGKVLVVVLDQDEVTNG